MIAYYRNHIDIMNTMDEAFEKRRNIPGLILLYSAIDSISNVANMGPENGKKVFMEWVDKWMLDKYPLPCNKYDIYSARCGLLHQHTSESSMTKKKEARHIHYVWGNMDGSVLQNLYDKGAPGINVVVKIEDLVHSFKMGMKDCWNAICVDEDWLKSFYKKADKFFISVDQNKNIHG